MELPAMLKGESLKRLALGAFAGFLATVVIGFNWGGWTLGSTAEDNATRRVNIALVQQRRQALGLIYAPALGRLYAGSDSFGSFFESDGQRRRIECRRPSPEGLAVVTSRSHQDPASWGVLLGARSVASRLTAGSSLKFGLVASGEVDAYPRTGRTWEWDTAAGHAIVAAAGGRVTCADGAELHYGKPNFVNAAFVARGLID